MKKIFTLIGLGGAFVAGCFLNKKYGWGIGDKVADKVQRAADFVADKLEKTRGEENKSVVAENITADSQTSAS